ncbi:MAG: class I SAM-dependent methyltransferase, partial [Burkholderiales bacterium]
MDEYMANTLDTNVAAYQGDNPYDFDNEILLTWYPKRVLHRAGSAGSMLELGLGHGFTTDIFAGRFDRHMVLEGSPAVIRNFREKYPGCRAQIVETYFETFATDERFEVIVMGFILEHVDDPLQILRRYRTFLAPDGKMFLAVPNAEVLNRRLGHIAGMLEDVAALSDNDRLLGHKRYYTVRSLTDVVEQAGYRIEGLEGIYLKPFTTSQIVALQMDRRIIEALCEVGVNYPELSCGILA